jgi:hypothetical protein
MALIPAAVFAKYQEVVDSMIEELGVRCTLHFPPIQVLDMDLTPSMEGSTNTNRFADGSVAPGQGKNSYMRGGQQYKEVEQTATITLRVYFDRKSFLKVVNSIDIPDGSIYVIGYIYDLPRFEQANYIIINSDQKDYKTWKYRRSNECQPWGFNRDKYFFCTMERM